MTNPQSLFKLPECIQSTTDTIRRQGKHTARTTFCLVCGDKARIINYGALSCASCKTFFRRHGFRIEKVEPCRFYGNCEIRIQSRRNCSACRLAKCLTIGMSPDLIRKEDLTGKKLYTTIKFKHKQNMMQQTKRPIDTLDLLNDDRCKLTNDDWILFSNIIHAYDMFSPTKSIHDEITRQSQVPIKLRMKFAQELAPNLVTSFYATLQSLIKCTNEFQMFSISDQQSIYARNFHGTSTLMGQLILRESGFFENRLYVSNFTFLYDFEILVRAASVMKRLECDGILVKVFLVVISFSSNCFMVDPSNNIHGDYIMRKTKQLFFYQNQYAELLWKYMMFRYGYTEAACRFARLVKQIIDIIPVTVDVCTINSNHKNLVNKIIEEAQQEFTIITGDQL